MTGYELRPARESDAEGICALWGGVFGDGEGFVREFLRVFGPGCGLVAVRGGSVAAMGFCPLGPEAAGYACGYIYAMATHPEHRGRGLAGEIALGLRAAAFERGADIVATLPASRSLEGWYAGRLDMRPVFRKGGEGVVFPRRWLDFAAFCGGHDPDTPDTLLAAARPGVNLVAVTGLGWECAFD